MKIFSCRIRINLYIHNQQGYHSSVSPLGTLYMHSHLYL